MQEKRSRLYIIQGVGVLYHYPWSNIRSDVYTCLPVRQHAGWTLYMLHALCQMTLM